MHINYVRRINGVPRPSEGDVKTLANGKSFVRRQVRVKNGIGQVIGRQVAHGRPVWEWVENVCGK